MLRRSSDEGPFIEHTGCLNEHLPKVLIRPSGTRHIIIGTRAIIASSGILCRHLRFHATCDMRACVFTQMILTIESYIERKRERERTNENEWTLSVSRSGREKDQSICTYTNLYHIQCKRVSSHPCELQYAMSAVPCAWTISYKSKYLGKSQQRFKD